jgi:hypothetical protein
MRWPRTILFVYGIIITGVLSYFIYAETMNVNDNLTNILFFETHSFADVLAREIRLSWQPTDRVAWRPGYFVITDLLQGLAGGREHAFYKTLQIALLAGAILIFLGLLQVKTWRECSAGAIALLVILGHQSIDGAVEAIYPTNPFVFVFFVQMVVMHVLLKPASSALDDILVLVLCVLAISITELGAIAGVTYIVGSLLRLPGASLRGAVAVFAVYGLFVLFRFLAVTNIDQLGKVAFEPENALFRAAAPVLGFLISDPRGGRFGFITVAKLMRGEFWAAVYIAGSVMLTGLILVWSLHAALRRNGSSIHDWKLAALLLVTVLLASPFGLASEKEYLSILSLPLYALVAYRALCWATERALDTGASRRAAASIVVGAILVTISATWSLRAAGLFYHLRTSAFSYQEEWAFDLERLGRMERYQDEHSQSIAGRLRSQALAKPLNYPTFVFPSAADRLLRGRGCPAIC